ncbi:MAG: YfiT family bacillithiol transferase [Bacteroidota bacterium]
MDSPSLESLKYPIGGYQKPAQFDYASKTRWMAQLSTLPEEMEKAVAGLNEDQLDEPYRPEGWTIREVIHHVPDSHLNGYIRFKWALTEQDPRIKPYFEDRWAALDDYQDTPIEVSLQLLKSLHYRWVILMKSLSAEDWTFQYHHPEFEEPISLDEALAIYAWHGQHHLAHITELRKRRQW